MLYERWWWHFYVNEGSAECEKRKTAAAFQGTELAVSFIPDNIKHRYWAFDNILAWRTIFETIFLVLIRKHTLNFVFLPFFPFFQPAGCVAPWPLSLSVCLSVSVSLTLCSCISLAWLLLSDLSFRTCLSAIEDLSDGLRRSTHPQKCWEILWNLC